MFWGCMISNRLPFIEKAIRKVFDKLGIGFADEPAFGCCPEPNGIKNYSKYLYHLAASRNLAYAEKEGRNIVTPCNGCFETLKSTASELKIHKELREKINGDLKKIGLEVSGNTDVMHLLEFFYKHIGTGTLKDMTVRPLNGLKVAVHYGCHFLRPSNKAQMDSPLDPHIFDELVEALGAESVKYDDKMLCCGGSFERAGRKDLSLQMIKHKLQKIREAGADVIVVNCPQCFIQFDFQQGALKKMEYAYDIPVLYYPELLALALGIPESELGFNRHKVKVDRIFGLIDERNAINEKIRKHFNLDFLKRCNECRACEMDCPPARFGDFEPYKYIEMILNGKIDEAVDDPGIWTCLDCYLCYELCPSKIGLVDVFTTLRNMAAKKGKMTEGFRGEVKSFMTAGMVGKFSVALRKRQGLPVDKPKVDDLVKLMNETDISDEVPRMTEVNGMPDREPEPEV